MSLSLICKERSRQFFSRFTRSNSSNLSFVRPDRTSISGGIDAAVAQFSRAPFSAERQTIDVSGDGTNNAGRDVTDARDDAVKAGITINGLAIINDHPVSWTYAHVQPPGGLTKYYRENVTGGPASFVLEVHDFNTFGEAMTRKLITEIAIRRVPTHLAANGGSE